MIRLFIALPLATEVEEELGLTTTLLKQKGGRVKWVEPKNMHLTVRFLGDTDEKLVDKIKDIIATVAGEFQPVPIVINRLGAFPNLSHPRVLWTGLDDNENVEILRKLTRQVELAVRKLRFEKEKRGFKPHLTLGRVKDPNSIRELISFMQRYQFTHIETSLDRLVLFKSTLTPKGPIYDRLYEKILGETN
jgi:2'-5' RNA ligase